MGKGIIELNDASIGLGIDGERLATSSGYAVLDQQNLILGKQAQDNFKLLPRWTNNRFWHQLNTDGLNNATPTIRHNADLAFAHLEELKTQLTCDDLIIAVPAHYDKHQLGLLLGMCREADLPVRAIVDLALVSIANQTSHADALFLDAGLHSISLTTLRTDGALRQTGHHTLLETGIATYFDRWASLIAEQFIQSSRFDPMHEAASEQQLFNGLPQFIENIGTAGALSYELDLGNVKHTTALSKNQLLSVTANAYPTIVQGVRQHAPTADNFTLFVSPRLKHFPDIQMSLSLIPGADVTYLDENQLIGNTQQLWDSLVPKDDSIPHVKTLSVSTPKPSAARVEPQATHLLIHGQIFHLKAPRSFTDFGPTCDGQSTNPVAVISTTGSYSGSDGVAQATLQVLDQGVSQNGEVRDLGAYELKIGDRVEINGHQAQVVAEQ